MRNYLLRRWCKLSHSRSGWTLERSGEERELGFSRVEEMMESEDEEGCECNDGSCIYRDWLAKVVRVK